MIPMTFTAVLNGTIFPGCVFTTFLDISNDILGFRISNISDILGLKYLQLCKDILGFPILIFESFWSLESLDMRRERKTL